MAVNTESTGHTNATKRPSAMANSIIKFLLQSPLHGMMSKIMLLLTFKGRKSGQHYTIPLGYHQDGNTVMVFTEFPWWKNIAANPEVELRIKGKKVQGRAEIIQDPEEVTTAMIAFFRAVPKISRSLRDDNGEPRSEAVRQAAQRTTCIRIQI